VLLRNDLEKVRMLAELVRKREKEKLRQSQVIKDLVDTFIFPHYGKLRLTLEKISACVSIIALNATEENRMDREELFLHPVNKTEVPDYFEVVKEPMCWLFIDEKLEKNDYLEVGDFKVG
jgi:NuA3 HAT complex component NTO1